MLFANKKEWSTDIRYSLEEPWKIYAKWKPEYGKDHVLYDPLYMKWPERGHQYRHTQGIPHFPSRLLEISGEFAPLSHFPCSQMSKLKFRLLSQSGTNIPCCQTSVSVQWLSPVWLFVTPWTAACQASLSITNSWSLIRLMSIELVMHPTISSSVVPFSSCLQSFPASGSLQMSPFFASGGRSIGVSTSASVLPMNIQDWFPLGLTGLMSLQSKWLSRVFSNTTVQNYGAYYGAPHYAAYSNSVKVLQYEDLAQPNK